MSITDFNNIKMETSIVDILKNRAASHPEKIAYIFLVDGEEESIQLNYRDLDLRAKAIASQLQSKNLSGERALLLYHASLEYITAFIGCLYAGVIAIPAYPPRKNKSLDRIESIVKDSGAKIAITTSEIQRDIQRKFGSEASLEDLQWLATDTIQNTNADHYFPIAIYPSQTAFLQYTSGSTGIPKGVIVTHQNIFHNEQIISEAFECDENTIAVGWLPIYHDMGLIGKVLQPIYLGVTSVLMAPVAFLQKPIRWLKAISKYKGTVSGAPNFAYDLCVEKITSEQMADLDLASWSLAFTGAEPIKWQTLERFTEKFSACGFRKEAFFPCYGMAEATLFITGASKHEMPVSVQVDTSSLEKDIIIQAHNLKNSHTLVSCGKTRGNEKIIIADPNTFEELPENRVGEVWFSGKSVAQGYWNRPDETKHIFQAYLEDQQGPFLRTGDLGFIMNNELFITGRLKDLIIINGRNHYPQDIEKTAEECHEALRSNSSAAFSIEYKDAEYLAIAIEVERGAIRNINTKEIIHAIREAIFLEHELQVFGIVLIHPGGILKTSSGKIQRRACKKAFLENTLPKAYEWRLKDLSDSTKEEEKNTLQNHLYNNYSATHYPGLLNDSEQDKHKQSKTRADELISWLREYGHERVNSRLIDERRCIPPYIILDFGNQGLLGMQVPKKYGGPELSNYDFLRVIEQLGAVDQTLASFVGINNVLGIRPILKYALPAVKDQLLPLLATGRELAAFAITEAGAGSNPWGLNAKAMPYGENRWSLQGKKVWIGSGSWAAVVNVFVKQLDKSGESKGISGFIIRQGTKGFRQGPEALTMGMRGMVQNSIFLEDVLTDSSQMLGKPGDGLNIAQETMMFGRLTIAAASIGAMKRCAQLMLTYSDKRNIATGALIENPATLLKLNDLTASITALEAFVYKIAKILDTGEKVPGEIFAVCKTSAPELLYKAADSLVQLLGGRGYIETNIAPQILRDARLARIFEGPTETIQMFIGSSIVNNNDAIIQFIENDLESPGIAQSLKSATEKVKEYYINAKPVFNTQPKNLQWVYILIGELATYATLHAAVKASSEQSTENRERAADWANANFNFILQKGLSEIYPSIMHDNSKQLKHLISDYSASIGDIEQTMAGEDHELDEMFKKNISQELHQTAHKEPQLSKSESHQSGKEQSVYVNIKDIERWILNWLIKKLELKEEALSSSLSFNSAGLDSITSVEFADELGNWLGLKLDPTIVWNFPTVASLSQSISQQLNKDSYPKNTEKISSETTIKTDKGLASKELVENELDKLKKMTEQDIAQLLADEIAMIENQP